MNSNIRISQILLKFTLQKPIVINNTSELLLLKNFSQRQRNVLIFKGLYITIKLFTATGGGYIFLRDSQTITNYNNIKRILTYFLKKFFFHQFKGRKIKIETLNFHCVFKKKKSSLYKNHSSFQNIFRIFPQSEETQCSFSKYIYKNITFTVYSKKDIVFTICTRQLTLVLEIFHLISSLD